MYDNIANSYLKIILAEELTVNHSPTRASYSGPLAGELINSPNLSVDDHLKAVEYHQAHASALKSGDYSALKFRPTSDDVQKLLANHLALISAHKDQIDRIGDQGNYHKD